MSSRIPYFLMPLVMIALITGTLTGWHRLGVTDMPGLPNGDHGVLMTGCFLGGLVMLERAVSIEKIWAFTGSILCGISLILYILSYNHIAVYGITLAAVIYIVMLIYQLVKDHNKSSSVTLVGAVCFLIGNILLLYRGLYPISVNWWMGFLLFTILGERLSLANAKAKIHPLILAVLGGLVLPFHLFGARVLGISLILLGLWLLYSEKYTEKLNRFKKYMNLAVIFANGWLIVTGVFLVSGAMFYDAQLHGFFLGFVFSMIFAHAPLMLPRVFKFNAALFHPVDYIFLAALQISLMLRVIGGIFNNDVMIWWGALTNGLVIILFFLTQALIIFMKRQNILLQK